MDTLPYDLTEDQLHTKGAFYLDDFNTAIIGWDKLNGSVGSPTRVILSRWAYDEVKQIAWSSFVSRDYYGSEQWKADAPRRARRAELEALGLNQFETQLELDGGKWFDMEVLINPRHGAPPARIE